MKHILMLDAIVPNARVKWYTTIVKVADHVLEGAITLKTHALDDSCGFCKKERPLMMLMLKFTVVNDIAERSIT